MDSSLIDALVSGLESVPYRCAPDPRRPMEFIGAGCAALTGYAPAEFTAGRVAYGDLLHPEDRAAAWSAIESAAREKRAYAVSYRILAADGRERRVADRGRAILSKEGSVEALEGQLADHERCLVLEEQLGRWQRLEAAGRLAGGVAHDFNNILTAVLGFAELTLGVLDGADPAVVYVREIRNAAARSAKLTKQLLAIGQKQTLQPRIVDLNALLGELKGMLRQLLGEAVEIRHEAAPDLGRIRVDPGQLEQVVMNLALNARDAMPRGGRLVFRTANARLEPAAAQAAGVAPGDYVVLDVSDTGTGMDAETRAHLFEPFFTTRAKAGGTGLGLATVYGIVTQSGGAISVASRPGGTSFTLHFPRSEDGLHTSSRVTPVDPERLCGTESILLVEDDPVVRSLARAVLAGAGYSVIPASDAEQALEVVRRESGTIHLLVTDVVMPRISGAELARRFAALRPGTKTLFISGYPREELGKRGLLDPGMKFLEKPFTPNDLLTKVRDTLDSPK